MTTPTYSPATSPAATAKRPQAIDPWDAPYFGGPIYLRFPTFSAPAAGEPALHAEAVPVEDVVELTPEPSQPVASPPPAEPVAAIADAPSPARRRGWLAGLFGR